MRASSPMLSWTVLAVLAGIAPSVRAEIRPCSVDEKAQTIRCRGVALPPPAVSTLNQARALAARNARQDAVRNMLEAMKGLASSGTELASSDAVRAKVEGLIGKAQVLDTEYFSDGGVAVQVEVPLESVSALLVPQGTKVVTGATDARSSVGDTVPVSALETKVPGASQH